MGPKLRASAGYGSTAFASAKAIPLASVPDGRQDGDDDRHRARDHRQRQAVIAAEMRGDAGLQRRVDRRQQIAELIDEAGERAARRVRATTR